jgi:hypothetical protein
MDVTCVGLQPDAEYRHGKSLSNFRTLSRVTFYYLLAEKYGKLSMFG